MTISVYQSTDTDAPVLTKEAGTLKTVLKACLVTGYGTTPGKGWNMPFEDGEKACFQSAELSATGCVLRVDDTPTDGRTLLAAYQTMSDVDTGTGKFSEDNHSIVKSYNNADTDPRPWTVVADEKRLFVFTDISDSFGVDALFFGDFTSYLPADNFNCMIMCDNSTSPSYRYPFSRNGEINCAADASQLNAKARLYASTIDDINTEGYNTYTYPSTITNGFCMFPAYLREKFAGSNDYRGAMPGLYYTPFDVADAIPDNTVLTDVVGVPTGQRILIKHVVSYQYGYVVGINVDEWV